MDHKDHLKHLLLKFSQNRCSPKEIDELLEYFQNNPEEEVLPGEEDVLNDQILRNFSGEERRRRAYFKLKKRISKGRIRSRNYRQYRYLALAASLTLMIGTIFYFATLKKDIVREAAPVASRGDVFLEREDGKITVLPEKGELQLTDKAGDIIGKQNGDYLVYGNSQIKPEKVVYNTLNVPYGKRFKVQLSDGSLVVMNAGSSLRYPVEFPKKGKREVFLRGEAFFDVAPDEKRIFVVEAQNLKIRVLGTRFNVSAYPEDLLTNVMLVEGSVKLTSERYPEKEGILKPGQLAKFERSAQNWEIQAVNSRAYTAWMMGDLVFRNVSFDDMLKKMERHYDVKIINNDRDLAKERFNAKFGNEPIVNILEYFKKSYGLNYVQKEGGVITINPKTKKVE